MAALKVQDVTPGDAHPPCFSFESVLRLLVSPQVHFPLEALPTQVAAERLEACVFPAVRDQVGALAEGLPAHLALVRLLTFRDKSERSLVGFFYVHGANSSCFIFFYIHGSPFFFFFFNDSYLCG